MTTRVFHAVHVVGELSDRTHVVAHLEEAHAWKFIPGSVDAFSMPTPLDRDHHEWVSIDGTFITPTSEYLRIHNELHRAQKIEEGTTA